MDPASGRPRTLSTVATIIVIAALIGLFADWRGAIIFAVVGLGVLAWSIRAAGRQD